MLLDPFLQGVEQFNQRQFYACHDTLEALWSESAEPHKSFYQGILQVAVGCYHLENHNWRGAVILLGEGVRRLSEYQPDYEGVDVTHLVQESQQLLFYLQQTEPERVGEVAKQLLEISENSPCSLPYILKIDELGH